MDDSALAGVHAVFTFKDGQITVGSVQKRKVFVNSRQIDTCTLAPLDVVQIGLFSIKAKASWKSLPAPPPVKPAPFE
ncbi:MAG: FHA domain-containing protein, partial [Nitrospinota bacterium]